jgi:hypothetical protein
MCTPPPILLRQAKLTKYGLGGARVLNHFAVRNIIGPGVALCGALPLIGFLLVMTRGFFNEKCVVLTKRILDLASTYTLC